MKLRTLTLLAVFCAAFFTSAHAQERMTPIRPGEQVEYRPLTPRQDRQIRRVLSELDAAVFQAFERYPDLRAEMEGELRRIAEIGEPADRSRAITEYQRTYRDRYENVLREGDVDLERYSGQVAAIVDGFGGDDDRWRRLMDEIEVEQRDSDDQRDQTPRESDDSQLNNYRQQEDLQCAPLFGQIQLAGDHVRSRAQAGGVGVCSASGSLSATIQGAPTQRVSLTADLRAHAQMFPIFGAGICNVMTRMYLGPAPDAQARSLQISIIAPVLWPRHVSDILPRANIERLSPGVDVTYSTFALAFAWSATGECIAEVNNFTTTVTP